MRRIWEKLARRARDESGFTLIELLVVLAILAAIAAIAIPRVMQTTGAANDTRDRANIAIIQSAVERYHIEEDAWPLMDGSTTQIDMNKLTNYLSQLPKDANGADQETWYLDSNHRVTATDPTPTAPAP